MVTVPPHAEGVIGDGTISRSGDELARSRRRFTFSCAPSTPRSEERLLLALVRLLETRLRHEWQYVAFASADVVFAPAGTPVIGDAFLIPLGSVRDDRTSHIVPPIHPSDVLLHLDRAGDAISRSRAQPRHNLQGAPTANIEVQRQASEASSSTIVDSGTARVRLSSWPAYELIRSDPLGLRIATLLASREWSPDELAARLQVSPGRCDQFLSLLVERGYGSWVGLQPRQADPVAGKSAFPAETAATQPNSQRQSLVAFIRRKLQI